MTESREDFKSIFFKLSLGAGVGGLLLDEHQTDTIKVCWYLPYFFDRLLAHEEPNPAEKLKGR